MDNGTNLYSQSGDDYYTISVNATNPAPGGSGMFEVVLNAGVDGTGGMILATSAYGSSVQVGDATNLHSERMEQQLISLRYETWIARLASAPLRHLSWIVVAIARMAIAVEQLFEEIGQRGIDLLSGYDQQVMPGAKRNSQEVTGWSPPGKLS